MKHNSQSILSSQEIRAEEMYEYKWRTTGLIFSKAYFDLDQSPLQSDLQLVDAESYASPQNV